MKTEIILFDSESYDPHKHKKYYSPSLVQLRTAVKPESKPYFWTPRLRLLLIAVLLMAGALSFGIYLLVNEVSN